MISAEDFVEVTIAQVKAGYINAMENSSIKDESDMIEAVLARIKPETDGEYSFGESLASCYTSLSSGSYQDNVPPEVRFKAITGSIRKGNYLSVLANTLLFMAWRARKPISYANLLDDLRLIKSGQAEEIEEKWNNDFYAELNESEEE